MRGRKRMPPERVELMRREYPTADLEELRLKMGLGSVDTLYTYAYRLGIKRDRDVHRENVSGALLDLFAKERRRIRWGLPQKTRRTIGRPLTHAESMCRRNLRKKGYIPGDWRQQGEARIIYYTDDTVRRKRAETFAKRKGFRFEKLEE